MSFPLQHLKGGHLPPSMARYSFYSRGRWTRPHDLMLCVVLAFVMWCLVSAVCSRPALQLREHSFMQIMPPANVELDQNDVYKGQHIRGSDEHNVKLSTERGATADIRPLFGSPFLEQALSQLRFLLPDEIHRQHLLRPIESGGKERMRELGQRTRLYRKYLDAWEQLHLIENDAGEVFVKEDMISYLRDSLHNLSEGHKGSEAAEAIRTYESFRAFFTNFAFSLFSFTAPYFADHVSLRAQFKTGGRGIVFTAGDKQATYLLTSIQSLRRLGCELAIEVMFVGKADLAEDYRVELEVEIPGVTTRDLSQMLTGVGWGLGGWATKPFAILMSSFREVIFIDADSFFFQDPATLFELPEYTQTGALFFRDRVVWPESKQRLLKQLLPKPIPKIAMQSRFWTGESGHMQESGVIVVDKWKHFTSMLLVCRLNGSDRDKKNGKLGVYDLLFGDKETFWIGFLLAGDESFAFHQGDTGTMGSIDESQAANSSVGKKTNPRRPVICAPQLLHLDTDGRPLWFNGGLDEDKYSSKRLRKLAKFQSYLVAPRQPREPTAWQIGEHNVACLTSDQDKKSDFTEHEQDILDRLLETAKRLRQRD